MFLDIGLGIIGAIIFSYISHIEISILVLVVSILFALLPDVDFIFKLVKHGGTKNIGHEHRDLLHYPLLYIPIGFLLIFLFSPNYAYLFVVLSLLHFMHDSIGIGWGILWAYPFSKRYYKFFSEKNGKSSMRLFISWTRKEQQEVSAQFGDKNWFRNIYMRPSLISVIEFLFFIFALICLWRFV